MIIIESDKQLKQLLDSRQQYKLIFPVWSSSTAHECTTTMSFIYCLSDVDTYIINLNHIDAERCSTFDIKQLAGPDTFVFGNRYIKSDGIDYEYAHFEEFGTAFSLIDFSHDLYKHYKTDYSTINDCIPLMKWAETLSGLPIPTVIQPWYREYSQSITVLGEIEGAGVKVDSTIFNSPYITGSTAYTKYNPYTATGRPSNRHGGINWAALPKGDGRRTAVISRWGGLVGMDYESYHLRLIARAAGYRFPDGESAHHHLMRWYGMDDPEAAKIRTFRLLYGGVDGTAAEIPFFRKTGEWMDGIWQGYCRTGVALTPLFGRPIRGIPAPTREKVVNYVVQALETEVNYRKLRQILPALGDAGVPILYTYDAVLFDCRRPEDVIRIVRPIMERGGLPVRVYAGPNYADLKFLS